MRKALPIGVMNYKELRMENYYTVDKTLMIKEFLDRKAKVTLITRPRRFGKTLNMSMMAEFFDITKDSKALFEGLAIMNTEYASYMNTKPVLYISFAHAKASDKESFLTKYFNVLNDVYNRYEYLYTDNKLSNKRLVSKLHQIHDVLSNSATVTDEMQRIVFQAIPKLLEALYEYYGQEGVYVFIDEYDTPFIEAYIHEFYPEVKTLLTSNLADTLKRDDDKLALAMITGIQRVAKENGFSGLNNLKVCTVNDEQYAQYFGFTTEETKTFLEAYGLSLTDEVKQMYDGYRIGNYEIFNPWSIIKYAKNKKLSPYSVNTSFNVMIKEAMKSASTSFNTNYESLIQTGNVSTSVNLTTSFYEVKNDASLWGLLVNAGYLTFDYVEDETDYNCVLRIPNREVLTDIKSITASYLQVQEKDISNLYKSFLKKDKEMFITSYQNLILTNPSYYDIQTENSVHMFMLGICLYIKHDYDIISNREEGHGRCNLILKAKKMDLPSYVIEFKHLHKQGDFNQKDKENLKQLAHDAVKQIEDKQYDTELTSEVIYIGLAHCGKHVECSWKRK